LVTSKTSFIVLDTLEQYLKYKIQPPPALVEIHQQYLSIIQEEEKNYFFKEEKKCTPF